MSKSISHGLYVSKIIWEAKGLTKGEALILFAVASRMGTKTEAWPSYSTLADKVKMRRPSAVRFVQRMRRKGLLDYTDDRKSNSYTINIELLLSMVESSRRELLADCVQVVNGGDQAGHRRLRAQSPPVTSLVTEGDPNVPRNVPPEPVQRTSQRSRVVGSDLRSGTGEGIATQLSDHIKDAEISETFSMVEVRRIAENDNPMVRSTRDLNSVATSIVFLMKEIRTDCGRYPTHP